MSKPMIVHSHRALSLPDVKSEYNQPEPRMERWELQSSVIRQSKAAIHPEEPVGLFGWDVFRNELEFE